MNMPSAPFARRHLVLAVAITAILQPKPWLQAANIWDGGAADGKWSTAMNWDDDLLPNFSQGVTFGGLTNVPLNNDLSGLTVGGITFEVLADPFTIGGNAITLSGGITSNATSVQTINLPMALAADTNVAVVMDGTVAIGPGAAGTGVISGSFGLTKSGAGTLTLGAANTYTGPTILDGGTVRYTANNTLGALSFGTPANATTASTNTSLLDLTEASLTVGSLAVQTNTGVPNIVTIGAGKALVVAGAATVAVPTVHTELFAGVTTNLTVTGAGAFAVNSGTGHFTVSLPRSNAAGGGDPSATLDLSGLSDFVHTATTGELRVGAGNAPGTLRLANTSNTITAAQVRVADTSLGVGDNGATSNFLLGAGTNTIHANNIIVGMRKGTGNFTFQTDTGSINIAGQAGGASVANITVGDASSGTGGGTSQFLLAGHVANVQAGIVRIGQLAGSSGGNTGGRVTFDTGTFNVSSLRLANHASGTAANGITGTFELGGSFPNPAATGVLNVTSEFLLLNRTIATGTQANGTFTINGGTANINADILVVDASTTGAARNTTLTLAAGTLNMMGHSIATGALPINNVFLPSAGQSATLANLGGTGINGSGLNFSSGGTLILEGINNYTGPTTINGGTLQVGTGGATGSIGSGAIANNGNLAINRTGTLTISGGISGTGSLQKDGTATVAVLGTSNYTGATAINAGQLVLHGTVGAITIGAGASLLTGAGTATSSLTASSLAVDGGNLSFDFDATGTLLNVAGAATFTGATTITPNPFVPSGTHTLVAAGDLALGSTPALIAPTGTRKSFALDLATPNAIKLVVTGASKDLVWTGGTNGVWDAGAAGTKNWNDGVISESYFDADSITFGNGPANRTITLTGITVNPAAITVFNSAANDYSISGTGTIAGLTDLVKLGDGALSLGTANTYSGGTSLLAGAIHVNHPTALGTGIVTINGGSLDNQSGAAIEMTANNPHVWNGNFTFLGSHPLNIGAGTVTLSTATTLTLNGSSFTIGGPIQGAFPLTKAGPGTLILTGIPGHASTVNTVGTLQIGNGGTSGALGSGPVTNNGTLVFNRSDDFTVNAPIDGAGDLVKAGAGTVTLTAPSTYLGPTIIGFGKIRVTNAAGTTSSLGAIPGGNVTVTAGAALDLSGSATAQALNFGGKQFRIEGTGPDGNGAIVNFGVSQFNALQQVVLTGNATVGGSQRFDIRSVPTSALASLLDLAGFTLTKSGANQFSLVGTDVTDGDIVVNQGIFAIETVTNIPDFGTGKKITLNAGTTLQVFNATSPASTVTRPIVFNGAGIQVGAANNANSYIGSPITLNGDISVVALNNTTAASTLTLTGNIGETGTRSITKNGPSVLALAGNNTFTGGVVINAGTVHLLSPTALGAAGSPLTLNAGATLDLGGNSVSVGALSGTGGTVTSTGAGDLTILTTSTVDTTFGGAITNGFATVTLHKRGSGALSLTGDSNHTGPTIVEQGTLEVRGSVVGNTFVDGGVLTGGGTLGQVHLLDGFIRPDGVLKTGILVLDAGELAFDLLGPVPGAGAGFYDQLQVTGAVELTGSVALTLNFATYDPVDFVDTFVLVNNDDIDPVNLFDAEARFAYNGLVLTEGASFAATSGANAQMFSITYAGGDSGNDVVLQAVPEPGAAVAIIAGLGVLAFMRPRRPRWS